MKIQSISYANKKLEIILFNNLYIENIVKILEEIEIILNQEDQFKEIEFDFSLIERIDCAGIGLLVGIKNRLINKECNLVIKNANKYITEFIKLTRLDNLYHLKLNS